MYICLVWLTPGSACVLRAAVSPCLPFFALSMVTSVMQCVPGAPTGPSPVPVAGWARGHLGAAELRCSENRDSCAGSSSGDLPCWSWLLLFFLLSWKSLIPPCLPWTALQAMEHGAHGSGMAVMACAMLHCAAPRVWLGHWGRLWAGKMPWKVAGTSGMDI